MPKVNFLSPHTHMLMLFLQTHIWFFKILKSPIRMQMHCQQQESFA